MGLMNKYNKGGVRFDVNIEGFVFTDLSTLYHKFKNETLKIDGVYINTKGSFDDHPVVIVADYQMLVDLPSYLTDDVRAMLKDEEVVSAIKAGKVGFTIHEYEQTKFKKTCYGIHWEDIA